MTEEFINRDPGSATVHVGSICEMTGGRLVACWYGGTREGARDTVIYLALRDPGKRSSWSEPRAVVDRDSASRELRRYVKKVGNSIIFADSEDRLWLIYVTITVGGWSGSSLNVKISHDGGTTWTTSQRLTLSPFLNVSELVRNNPLPMKGGGFVIPIYHECLGKFPEILWIRRGQRDQRITFRKTRMAGGRSFIQPSVVGYDSSVAKAFYRGCSDDRDRALNCQTLTLPLTPCCCPKGEFCWPLTIASKPERTCGLQSPMTVVLTGAGLGRLKIVQERSFPTHI
jgi:predicted neuraminidase